MPPIEGPVLTRSPNLWEIPVAVHAQARDTEIAAALKASAKAYTLRMAALSMIVRSGSGGMTANQVIEAYRTGEKLGELAAARGMQPRVSELAKAGAIIDSGRRRDGGIVWIVPEAKGANHAKVR